MVLLRFELRIVDSKSTVITNFTIGPNSFAVTVTVSVFSFNKFAVWIL